MPLATLGYLGAHNLIGGGGRGLLAFGGVSTPAFPSLIAAEESSWLSFASKIRWGREGRAHLTFLSHKEGQKQ